MDRGELTAILKEERRQKQLNNQNSIFKIVNKIELIPVRSEIYYFDEIFLFAKFLAGRCFNKNLNTKHHPLKGKSLGKFMKLKYK